MVQQGEITGRVSLFSTQPDVEVIPRLKGRDVLAFVGAALMLLSIMLVGTEGGPTLTDETSLFQLFGFIGLFLGVVLILRVTLAALCELKKPRGEEGNRSIGAGDTPLGSAMTSPRDV